MGSQYNERQQPVVEVNKTVTVVEKPVEEPGIFSGLIDSIKNIGKDSPEDNQKKIVEINEEIKKLETKKKELEEQPGTNMQQPGTVMQQPGTNMGGRRRSRKQAGGRRRRTRRGKRSGCKRCGLKQCGCSKKRRTRR